MHSAPDCVDELWPATDLPKLLQQSDIVILCVPLNAQTEHMIGKAQFDLMKPGAVLINVARGQVIDEASMVAALRQEKRLYGVGVDVTEVEPLPTESPLWDMPNVIITPHVGAQSARRADDTTDLICDNLRRYFAKGSLRNLVDKNLGFPTPAARRGE